MSYKGISKLVKFLKIDETETEGEDIKRFKGTIEKITKEEKVIIARGFYDPYGGVVYDSNPLHYDIGVAKKVGYDDTPIYATMLAGRLEFYILSLLREINMVGGENLVYAGQQINFKRPLYPENEANWDLVKAAAEGSGLDLEISLINKKGRPYFICSSDGKKTLGKGGVKLRHKRRELSYRGLLNFLQYGKFQVEEREHPKSGKFITEDEKEINEEGREQFYKSLGKIPKAGVLISQPAAFIPAALLEYSIKQSGDPELTAGSLYKSMDLNFHNQPGIGLFKTMIMMPEEPVKNKKMPGYDYVFNALCMQEGLPILSGKVEFYSPFGFEI